MNRNGIYKYGNVGVMGAGPGSERWMNVPYIENNAIVLDIPPPKDSVSRAAVRPQPLAVTQGEPIREDEEHQEEPWEGRHDGTKIDVRRAHFTLTCDIDNPHSPKYYGSNASSDPTATTNQPHQLRF